MMERTKKWALGIGAVVLSVSTIALAPPAAHDTTAADGAWEIEAKGVRIIGGYGDNFAYDGQNVRPLAGSAHMTVDPDQGTARLEIELQTTQASGPIRFSQDQSWEGQIRIVQKIDTDAMDKARIAEEIFLHGNTGNEAPVMPKIYNYFATWGPAKIMVNGEEAISMIGSHTMFTEQARGENGKIVNRAGLTYSPKRQEKSGFTTPNETEFHFVAHTTKPDPNNFPPHSGWIHLHFSEVEVEQKPADVEIPYVKSMSSQ